MSIFLIPCILGIDSRTIGQVTGDGKASCFSNAEDTGIPALQDWCHQLTVASRERAARGYRLHVKTFATTVQSYIQGIEGVTVADRKSLRDKWESTGLDDENNEPEDPLQALFGSLGPGYDGGLYSMGINRPAPKVDREGRRLGITPRLCGEFAELVDECVKELEAKFSNNLDEKCRIGAANVSLYGLYLLQS